MHYRAMIITGVLLVLAACGGVEVAAPTATRTPLSPVEIGYPQDGTVIYSESIHASGRAVGDVQQFRLEVVDIEERVVAEMPVNVEAEQWAVELMHGYEGEPSEMTIRAVLEGGSARRDTVTILLSDRSHRPPGSFGRISVPVDGATVGGDVILVEGWASGLPENNLVLELTREDGTLIDQQIVTLTNPNFIDEVPWQAEVALKGYTGPAQIRAYTPDPSNGEETLDTVNVTVTVAAG